MKRFIAIVTTLVLLMTSFTLPAYAADTWTCPNCSSKNNDNFCPDCGTKKPEALKCKGCGYTPEAGANFKFCPSCGLEFGKDKMTPTPTPRKTPTPTPRVTATPKPTKTPTPKPSRNFGITNVQVNENGTVTIAWADDAKKGPYKVCYEQLVSDNYYSDEQNAITRWIQESTCHERWCKMTYLDPGTSYWFSVTDSTGETVRYAWHASRASSFSEFTVTMDMKQLRQKGSEASHVTFSASEIEGNSKYSYGASLKLTYSQLAYKRTYSFLVTVTDPTGIVQQTDYYSYINLPRGRSYYNWDFYSFDEALENAKKQKGYIPRGQWTVSLYFNGLFVNSAGFNVGY